MLYITIKSIGCRSTVSRRNYKWLLKHLDVPLRVYSVGVVPERTYTDKHVAVFVRDDRDVCLLSVNDNALVCHIFGTVRDRKTGGKITVDIYEGMDKEASSDDVSKEGSDNA